MQQGTVIAMTGGRTLSADSDAGKADGCTPALLFQRHYRPLVAALAVACGSRDLAADSVQDAFVELCKRWAKVGNYDRPEAWLMRVALNRARSEQRSLRRRAAALLRMTPSQACDPVPVPDRLARAFRGLPERQRIACSLFYILDLPLDEVARVMGISQGAAGAHLHRARKTMRTLLEESA